MLSSISEGNCWISLEIRIILAKDLERECGEEECVGEDVMNRKTGKERVNPLFKFPY